MYKTTSELQPIFSQRDGGRRLLATIQAWEQDPKRWQKLHWSGLDNSDTEDESDVSTDVHLDDQEDISEEHYSDEEKMGTFEGINIDDDDFVEDDTGTPPDVDNNNQLSAEQTLERRNVALQEMQSIAPPAPLPQFVTIAKVSIPCMTAGDCQHVPESEQKCIVCNEHSVSVVLVPCGHATTCLHCIYHVCRSAESNDIDAKCPKCRANIEQVIRLYHD